MYALAKFQSDNPITLGVRILQNANNKKIDLYSKHWENKLQALTKADVTYERNVTQSCNLHHHVCHEEGHLLLGKFFPASLSFTMYRDEICEEKSIAYNSFDMMETNSRNSSIL